MTRGPFLALTFACDTFTAAFWGALGLATSMRPETPLFFCGGEGRGGGGGEHGGRGRGEGRRRRRRRRRKRKVRGAEGVGQRGAGGIGRGIKEEVDEENASEERGG